MSEQALVAVDPSKPPGSADEIVQRGFPLTSINVAHGIERRRTLPLFGLGYLEYASQHLSNRGQGKFGAFATVIDLRTFVAQAFAVELGVSSSVRCARKPDEKVFPARCSLIALSDADLDDVVSYLRYLAPPPHHPQAVNSEGGRIFVSIGCSACHTRLQITSADSPPPFNSRIVEVYSDLNTHDMGSRAPIKTRPLWGLNSFGPPYMHDGCGISIEVAIECHRGSGAASAVRFSSLSVEKRAALVAFLRSL